MALSRPRRLPGPALLGARRALQIGDKPLAVSCLELFAVAAAAGGDYRRTAAILAAGQAAREAMGIEPDPPAGDPREGARAARPTRTAVIAFRLRLAPNGR